MGSLNKASVGIDKIKHYFSAGLLTTLAGLITFPVLTRLLSKADYGVYSLIQGIQLFYEAILKGGGQFSLLRFYPSEYLAENKNKKIFISTYLVFPLLISSVISLICSIGIIVYSYFVSEIYLAILVVISAQSAIILSYFRSYMQAAGLSKYDSIISVIYKYLYLVIVVPVVIFILSNYWGVYWAVAISTFVTACVTVWLNRSVFEYVSLNIDKSLFWTSLKFSFPLLLTEISILSISYVDRFVMAALDVNMSDIGIYAIGFGLANVIFMLIWKTIQPSIFPNANLIHDVDGAQCAVDYLSKAANFFVLFFIALITGIALNGSEFIILLCGQDKSDAGPIFFLATALFLIKMVSNFLFYGLELYKNTKYIFYSELLVAVINIILNVFLISLYGMYGAMLASFLSVIFGMIFKYKVLRKEYRLKNIFRGTPKLIFSLLLYSLFHICIIENHIENSLLIMTFSISVFIVIMLIMKDFWLIKFKNVFDS